MVNCMVWSVLSPIPPDDSATQLLWPFKKSYIYSKGKVSIALDGIGSAIQNIDLTNKCLQLIPYATNLVTLLVVFAPQHSF